MQLSKAVLASLLLSVATAHPPPPGVPHHGDPKKLAPHVAREIVDKTPVLHVSTIDKDEDVPVAHIERHISSDSCEGVDFANSGNPILLLSKLNNTFANCQENKEDVSITIEHPPFHGQDVFVRPRINLYGSVEELKDLSEDEVHKLKKCFKKQNRATKEWLNDDDVFFAEFDVDKVWFTGDFGFGDFTGDIDGETYHSSEKPHQPPPCPWHLPPKPEADAKALKHGRHHNKDHEEHKSHHQQNEDYEPADTQTVFEILKIWFNNY